MLELPPVNDSTPCLTLSFGIHVDASFDKAMLDMNCEVHMFDMLDYSPTKLLKSSHAHFHQVRVVIVLIFRMQYATYPNSFQK